MGLLGGNDDTPLENADLDCSPQNDFANKEEVEKIDDYLDPGEKVHFLARSAGDRFEIDGEVVDDISAQRTAATDKRLVIKKSKNPFGYESQSIKYDNISSVDRSFGMMKKKIRIETSSKVYGIGVGQLSKNACEDMAQFIRSKVSEAQDKNGSDTQSESAIDKLESLRDLKEDGIITQEELDEKKEDLLDDI